MTKIIRFLEIPKWIQTIRVSWSILLAYKTNFLITILGPSIIFFFVKYSLWISIYESLGAGKIIQNYTLNEMLQYQIWVLIAGLISQCYTSINIAQDIRLGNVSTYLIYPFNFWQFHTANFFSLVIVQIFIAAVTLAFVNVLGLLTIPNIEVLIKSILLICLVSTFWYSVQFILGILAFWLDETWALRVLFTNISIFLSGAIMPLDIYPKWFNDIIYYTPFPHISYVPVRYLMGEYQGNIWHSIGYLIFWIALMSLFSYKIWKSGMKHYTAAGM